LTDDNEAMNIMATFIHNEPTSLPTIQEVGLPQVFYKVIEAGLEPVIEVIFIFISQMRIKFTVFLGHPSNP